MNSFNSIDEYILNFPEETRVLLEKVRHTIRLAAPEANETIKYAMPTFQLYGNLVHFAAFKNHIGFYPAPSGLNAFREEVNQYKNSKGAIQFPIDKELPLELVDKIVRFRVAENLSKKKK